jgi:hypothetical protein
MLSQADVPKKSSTSRCEDYSGCSPGRYGGRLRGIEMVFVADYRAAVSSIVASFVRVRVSDPTTRPSMALFIVTGVDYFVSATTVHPPCINTCLASLASPPPQIIHTPPRLYICSVSLAPPPPSQIIYTPRLGVAGFTTAADCFYSAMDSACGRQPARRRSAYCVPSLAWLPLLTRMHVYG